MAMLSERTNRVTETGASARLFVDGADSVDAYKRLDYVVMRVPDDPVLERAKLLLMTVLNGGLEMHEAQTVCRLVTTTLSGDAYAASIREAPSPNPSSTVFSDWERMYFHLPTANAAATYQIATTLLDNYLCPARVSVTAAASWDDKFCRTQLANYFSEVSRDHCTSIALLRFKRLPSLADVPLGTLPETVYAWDLTPCTAEVTISGSAALLLFDSIVVTIEQPDKCKMRLRFNRDCKGGTLFTGERLSHTIHGCSYDVKLLHPLLMSVLGVVSFHRIYAPLCGGTSCHAD